MLFWIHRGIFFDQFVSHFHPGIMEFKKLLGISRMRTNMKFHVSPFFSLDQGLGAEAGFGLSATQIVSS